MSGSLKSQYFETVPSENVVIEYPLKLSVPCLQKESTEKSFGFRKQLAEVQKSNIYVQSFAFKVKQIMVKNDDSAL